MSTLAALARDLRARHFATETLVLANVWDASSARAVAEAGHPVIATSSAAVAASLGTGDHEQMTADEAFDAVGRIAHAVGLPVTADLEAGYGLTASELVDRLLDAGAVGCNLEDTDHHGQGPLLDVEGQAAYISAVCESARARGVDLVVNARVDVYIRDAVPKDQQLEDTLRRGHRYLEAGATCIYPIGLTDEGEITRLVEEMGGPLNVWLRPESPPLDRLRSIGVARVSLASGLHRQAMASVREGALGLLSGARATRRE
jgi:2-methylisocitrate lyase-like PEP mutase family enzyme